MSLMVHFGDRGRPDGQHEGNLVDEIGNVVDEIEHGGGDGAGEEAEEISQGVDGPADGDNGAHGVEGGLDWLGSVRASLELASLTGEDLEEDEEPAAAAEDEAHERIDGVGLAEVAEQKHAHGADQQTPEDAGGSRANGAEDEVELDHLKRDGEGPVNVTVDGGGLVVHDPVLTHVEVMDGGDQGDEGAGGDRDAPVAGHAGGFHEEENSGGNHRNGDDPEGNTDGIMGSDPCGGELVVDEAGGVANFTGFVASESERSLNEGHLDGHGLFYRHDCKESRGSRGPR